MATFLLVVTGGAGCSADEAGRPGRAALAEVMEQSSDLDREQSGCAADKLLASGLSDKVLRGLAEDDDSGFTQEEKTRAGEEIVKAGTACAKAP